MGGEGRLLPWQLNHFSGEGHHHLSSDGADAMSVGPCSITAVTAVAYVSEDARAERRLVSVHR